MYILSLDQGSNSIGWAVIDKRNNKLINSGVRIFQEGVENLGDGEREISKNAARREFRQKRKQGFRRKMRKKLLLKVLRQHKLCPLHDREMTSWFSLNPYTCRANALEKEVSLHALGRAFYHMSQRRGFLSNSKSATSNTDSAIYQSKGGKIGITETEDQISKTLGSYLNSIKIAENKSYSDGNIRIRNRYTTRKMYLDEFEAIWNNQAKYHSILTPKLKEKIGGNRSSGDSKDGILFFQRPLKSQKHLIGKCSFEPNKRRAPVSSLLSDQVRVWQFINSIRCNGEKLDLEEKQCLFEYLILKEKIKFKSIRIPLKKKDGFYRFNYLDDDPIVCAPTHSKICSKKGFGTSFLDLSLAEQEKIWHILYFFDNAEKTYDYAIKNWHMDKSKALYLSKIYFKKDYGSISRYVQEKILYFLELGLEYDIAIVLAGVKKVLKNQYPSNEQEILLVEEIKTIIRSKISGGFIEPLQNYLLEHYDLTDQDVKSLYHHSVDTIKKESLDTLPVNSIADKEIQSIRNPVVITALFELRRLVNALLEKYGKFDSIKLEIGRDLKQNKLQRQSVRINNKRREANTDRIIKDLKERDINPFDSENILKYKLWEECNHICPYTGNTISFTDLFINGFYDIEHIIPYSRSLDDSFLNKTLCESSFNRTNKAKKIPFECYDSDSWEVVKKRALSLFYTTKEFPSRYKKYQRFVTTKLDEDFISRQLNDTRYISKISKKYLEKICSSVQVSPGQLTSKLRYLWGLNNIIRIEDKEKNRSDHRHHAIDAIVVAYITPAVIQKVSHINRHRRNLTNNDFPAPYEGFWIDVKESISNILISFRKSNKDLNIRLTKTIKKDHIYINQGKEARGPLHKESVYGKRNVHGEKAFHIRKKLDDLTTNKHIAKVVSRPIQKLLLDQLEALGVNIHATTFKVPKGAFFNKKEDGTVEPLIFLPNKNGDPVPVNKVRIRENIGNAVQLKGDLNQYVNPRNNDHIVIYRDDSDELQEEVVTFWEVIERKKQGQQKYQLPADGISIEAILKTNDMYVLGLNQDVDIEKINKKDLSHYVYRVQKISSSYYTFRHHLASTLIINDQEISIRSMKKWEALNPIKVSINIAGEIEF